VETEEMVASDANYSESTLWHTHFDYEHRYLLNPSLRQTLIFPKSVTGYLYCDTPDT